MLEGHSNFVFVQGDITDVELVNNLFEKYKIETVLHLAAESHVDNSFGNPFQFTQTNVLGTQVILETAKKFKIRRLIHMSTDEVYGEVGHGEKDLGESSILAPTNPYSASKAAADMLVGAYLKSFGVPAIVLRCNNVFGPLQFPEKVIPKFTLLLASGQKCQLHGDGSNTRRYLYVTDAVDAIDTVLHKGVVGKIYNAGSDTELSNFSLCKTLMKYFGWDSQNIGTVRAHIEYTTDRPFNDLRYAIDSSELQALGWKPKKAFADGLRETVQWYLKHGMSWWGSIDDFLVPFPSSPDSTLYHKPNLITPSQWTP